MNPVPTQTYFLSEKFSDIRIKIIGSDNEHQIIPAHKVILSTNSEYFEVKINELESLRFAHEEGGALIVDVSEIGTVSDVLDILKLFYFNVGNMPNTEERFANLNEHILAKFLVRDIVFDTSLFSGLTFGYRDYDDIIGKHNNKKLMIMWVNDGIFYISCLQPFDKETINLYNRYNIEIQFFLEKNNIDYDQELDHIATSVIRQLRMDILIESMIIIHLEIVGKAKFKILMDEIIKHSDDQRAIMLFNNHYNQIKKD